MKKIVLGCAAVLLSLGLLAGCNNKEDEPPITEAVSLSVSQTSVNLEPGGSAEVTYTVSPEKATVMALSDHEEYVTAVAQNGTIYLEAVAAGSAIVSVGAEYEGYASAEAQITVTVSEVLEPEPVVPTVSLTLTKSTLNLVLPDVGGTADPEPIEYTVAPTEEEGTVVTMEVTAGSDYITLCSPEEAVEAGLEEGWYVTPVEEGEATISVTAECEGYEPDEATIEVKVHETGWVLAPYTIRFKLTNSNGDPLTITEGINCYAVGDLWTDTNEDGDVWWDIRPEEQVLVENEINGTTYYDVVIEDYTEVPTISEWGGKIELIAYNNDETLGWDTYYTNVVYTDNIENGLTPEANGVYTINAQLAFESWDAHFDHSHDVQFYILVVNSATDGALPWTIGRIECQDSSWTPCYAFDGESKCDTVTGTTNGGTYYFYNSVAGTVQPGTDLYFYCSVDDSDWSVEVDTNSNSTITVPETEGDNVAIWVSGGAYTAETEDKIMSTTDLGGERGEGGWVTDYASIEAYLAAVNW